MRPARGFTLVEMLVALLVFGTLAAGGVVVLANAADHQSIVDARLDRLLEMQRARALLEADLSQAAPRRTRDAAGDAARNAFTGATTRAAGAPRGVLLAFVRRDWHASGDAAGPGLVFVEYRLVDGRLERATRAALDGTPATDPRVLLTGVQAIALAYRDRGAWSDGWAGGADALPEAVRMDLELVGIGQVPQLFLLPEAPR